jgi:glutamate-1-semialdehyde 2,1-aminomutase
VARHTEKSQQLFLEAQKFFPGGVNSPVRAFRAVGLNPPFIEKAQGAYIWDADGQKYIDYVASWGPAILGHSHPEVIKAIKDSLENGLSFGAPTEQETALAKWIQKFFPSMEMMRLVSSGTEACMSALRLARGFTGRHKIIKFSGCYHGHADMLLAKAGSGVATFGLPDSQGVPAQVAQDTLIVQYNDIEHVESLFKKCGDEIAAVIVEPIAGNMGFVRGTGAFLGGLRRLTEQHDALLIFDEVMTGFRAHPGGVQALAKIKPDITTLGKILGGGMPIAAYGGRRDIMEKIAPLGPVYQAGTLSGHPSSVAAGIKTLEILGRSNFEELSAKTSKLCEGFDKMAQKHQLPFVCESEGGMFGFFFADEPVDSFEKAKECHIELFKAFFGAMLDEGIYLAPSAYEAGFVSFAHTLGDIDRTIQAADQAMAKVKGKF